MSVAAVARVAFLASDVLVDSKPPLPAASPFGTAYAHLSGRSSTHTPALFSLPHGADPGSTLLRHRSASLLSFTAQATGPVLTRLVPHLAELASVPVVLHLAVHDDLADALLLRSSVPYFLYSATPEQAADYALLASRLAHAEKKAVVHAFYAGPAQQAEVEELPEEKVWAFLKANKPAPPGANGLANGLEEENATVGLLKAFEAAAASTLALTRQARPPYTTTGPEDPHTVVFTFGRSIPDITVDDVSFINVSLFSPLPASRLLSAIPPSTRRIIVLEQIHKWTTKWTPFYLDIVSFTQHRDAEEPIPVYSGVLGDVDGVTAKDVLELIEQASSSSPSNRLQLGSTTKEEALASVTPHVPKHEASYTKILAQLFGDRLDIANSPELVASQGAAATNPEFALGRVRGQLDARAELVSAVDSLLGDFSVPPELHKLLVQWTQAKDDSVRSRDLGSSIASAIDGALASLPPAAARVLALKAHLAAPSRWIIGSDAWAYDLGASGLHHVVASGLDVNVLVLDTTPYSARAVADPARRKQDVGLYAMNHGDVYVASVAVYASYAQVLQALAEADRYKGPSVVLAYLPYAQEDCAALEVLKETKRAVDAGYWPLYRWNPAKEQKGEEPFVLDSDAVKNELRAFLDRQNHLSQLTRATPQLAAELVGSLGENVKEARKLRAQKMYEDLVSAIDAPPLTVLYASDGGKAEKVAKRLAVRAKARGLSATVTTMDSTSISDIGQEQFVAFVASSAGQGEFPQNGRTLMKALNAAVSRSEQSLTDLRFAVFGMGDSHYWPRPEDKHYYNKAGKDLDARLAQLGATRFTDVGLGDDQDPDGPETGYKAWEPLVWKALGVDAVEVREAEPEPITNEHIKAASQYLRGTIAEGLQDTTTGALAPADTQLTKFHGIYQQDDRDIRDERQAEGAEPAYSFMIRVRLPGGVCTPEQWLAMDQIADEHGNGTFKITTRQTFQFHGVIKKHLKPSIQAINRSLLDTLAACGDVNRSVIYPFHFFF